MTNTAPFLPTTADDLLRVFKALANPERLQILSWLREPEQNFPVKDRVVDAYEVGVCVTDIKARTTLGQSTISEYMAILERAGLVQSTRVGKWRHYRRDEAAIDRVVRTLGHSL
jgi:DNA-binding transcriptional ArsR family regulator